MAEVTCRYGIVTMCYPLKMRILLMILAHTWLSVAAIGATLHNDLPVGRHLLSLPKRPGTLALKAAHMSAAAEPSELAADSLPLVKVAHKNVMYLLNLFFVAKPIHMSSYTPFVHQLGIRVNWLECLRNLWTNDKKSYGGGVDLQLRGSIQLSIAIGYASEQPKDRVYRNQCNYQSKGRYGLGSLLYLIHPNRLTNVYWGIGYGQSYFDLIIFGEGHTTATVKPFVANWIKFIGGSELRLLPQLYGGMQLGLAYLLHCKKNDDGRVSNYLIPGYSKIVNKIVPDGTLYLKWSISFLEKKIVI